MLKLFKEIEGKLVSFEEQDKIFEKIERNMWIHVSEPDVDTLTKLSKIVKIDFLRISKWLNF